MSSLAMGSSYNLKHLMRLSSFRFDLQEFGGALGELRHTAAIDGGAGPD